MRIKNSITIPIVLILLFLASGILLAGYTINKRVFYEVFEEREKNKLENIHLTVESLISGEMKRISGFAKVLKNDTDIVYGLFHYRASGDKKPLRSAMDQLYPQMGLQILAMADARGNILYSAGKDSPKPKLKGSDPFERAIRGDQSITVAETSEVWSLQALVPIYVYDRNHPSGVLVLGSRIDDDFAKKIARETGSQVFIANLDGFIAGSYRHEDPGALDMTLVEQSLLKGSPIFQTDPKQYRSYTYVPSKIVDGEFCLVIESDISVIKDLLRRNRIKMAQWGLILFIGITLIGIAFTFILVKPLKDLEGSARRLIREYSGKELATSPGKNEISALVGAIHAMVETIKSHIAERIKAEESLRETGQTLQALIEASPLAIVVTDAEGIIRVWNPAAVRILGWREEEALGLESPIFSREGNSDLRSAWDRTLKGEEISGREIRCENKEGSEVVLEFFGAPLADDQAKIVGMMAILADKTESRRAEEALRQSEEKLRQSQKMEAVGKLAGGVAHDFNNILSLILGYGEHLLGRCGATEPGRREIEQILKAGERGASLTRQLLAFSRQQVLIPETIRMNGLLSDLSSMLRRLIGEDIELDIDPDPELWPIEADPNQIYQIILNLTINARDAMPNGGTIRISTANARGTHPFIEGNLSIPEREYVRIEFTDTGCGMDRQTLSRIFEPFFTTKGQGKGTGLGLATVYGIVKQSGGFIHVRSEPGCGTTFTLFLPRSRKEETKEDPQPASTGSKTLSGDETILVAEDEEMVRELVCETLRERGYSVLEASNGEEAISASSRCPETIHLLISDAVMPGMNGIELARRLRAVRPGIPVLLMSGYAQEAVSQIDTIDAEYSFLQKPVTPSRLCEKIRQILSALPPAKTSPS